MRTAYLVAGLGYGDEGKGTIVDFLTKEKNAKYIVRYNGGSQAAHHVVEDEIVHCFSQIGSGSFKEDALTIASEFMLVDPFSLEEEVKCFEEKGLSRYNNMYNRITVDGNCLVITPFHKIIGQMQEISRGERRHGSCGKGVGAAISDSQIWKDYSLKAEDLSREDVLRAKLDFLWRVKVDVAEQIIEQTPHSDAIRKRFERIRQQGFVDYLVEEYLRLGRKLNISNNAHLTIDDSCIFEGAQGVLLDQDYGFWPYVTKTRTTYANALRLLEDVEEYSHGTIERIEKIGVLRAYCTRHGAGPFVSEDIALTINVREKHNATNPWQGAFRNGWFDVVAERYAIEAIGGVDYIAMTNIDRLDGLEEVCICTAYEYNPRKNEDLNLAEKEFDEFFEYENHYHLKRITRIKVPKLPTKERQQRLSEILGRCTPIYERFKGWKSHDIDRINATKNLGTVSGILAPEDSLKVYLDYIESERGLNVPINILSFGPESKNKIRYRSCRDE